MRAMLEEIMSVRGIVIAAVGYIIAVGVCFWLVIKF